MDLFNTDGMASYVVTQFSWDFVVRTDEGFKGWPTRVLTPRLSKEDAELACQGLRSRAIMDPDQYAVVPAWAWEGNQEWRDKGLSSETKVPAWVRYQPPTMAKL